MGERQVSRPLSIREVARVYRVSRKTVQAKIDAGVLPVRWSGKPCPVAGTVNRKRKGKTCLVSSSVAEALFGNPS